MKTTYWGRVWQRVGSGRVRLLVINRGSGRVNISAGRVGSGPRKVTRGQLWFVLYFSFFLPNAHFDDGAAKIPEPTLTRETSIYAVWRKFDVLLWMKLSLWCSTYWPREDQISSFYATSNWKFWHAFCRKRYTMEASVYRSKNFNRNSCMSFRMQESYRPQVISMNVELYNLCQTARTRHHGSAARSFGWQRLATGAWVCNLHIAPAIQWNPPC